MENIEMSKLLNNIYNRNNNILILGSAGSGKSKLIKEVCKVLKEVIVVGPSGISAIQIAGKTIQYFFCIKPNEYRFYGTLNIQNTDIVSCIKKTSILLIDEISMVRLELLDIVNEKLKIIRKSILPFGGLRLIFIGDTQQLGPVVKPEDAKIINQYYNIHNDDYSFYKSNVFNRYNLLDTFTVYELMHDYRHQNDIELSKALSDVRLGNITNETLSIFNKCFTDKSEMDDSYQYLTTSHKRAKIINDYFLKRIVGDTHYMPPIIEPIEMIYDQSILKNIPDEKKPLPIKRGMKIIFDRNDYGINLVNGTIGTIVDYIFDDKEEVIEVIINVQGNEHRIKRIAYPFYLPITNSATGLLESVKIADVFHFPFIPAWAITIDKSQGLTLDKIYIVLDNNSIKRENQLYVALSRGTISQNIKINKKLTKSDFIQSKNMTAFYNSLSDRIIKVMPDELPIIHP
jgi:DNA replicative helicase MCM subunit Mcm2 (Cdc46/Mcm family)